MRNRESFSAQDARVEELWQTLDANRRGFLDLKGLKRGLKKLDHPLKYADTLLKDVLEAIDTDHDGRITYPEFHSFVQQTESQLRTLFNEIDINHDGKLDRQELSAACQRAGLAVSNAKLDRFFEKVDSNNDGLVSFREWADFLLFIPTNEPDLREVLSYFSSAIKLTSEGDVQLSDETIQGIGTLQNFLSPLFGTLITALVAICRTPQYHLLRPEYSTNTTSAQVMSEGSFASQPAELASAFVEQGIADWTQRKDEEVKPLLISLLPTPGYFVAGGLAGIISRTTTAPLDRLKVYLIAQVDNGPNPIQAVKSGAPIQAVRGAYMTSAHAMKELWAAGGMRSIFAGNGLNVVKVMPESAIKFGTYESCKRICTGSLGLDPKDPAPKFVAGGISGMVAQFAVYPLDTLKFRMQCETVSGGLQGARLIHATAQKMWRANGVSAFYRGLPMGVIGIFPYAAIDMGTFEYLKRRIALHNAKKRGCHEDDAKPGSFLTAVCGGFSGALGASMVYPLNLLRTRLQSQGTVLHPRTYTGIMDVFHQTIKGEGVRGLFKGLTPNLLKVVPAVSITWVVYENCKKRMDLK
ncbi:hypothetical protein BLS_009518 [Venturia inaequalis]|uniref:Mitochondrial thiamine pyrophosphate carrier 1 n=1 Tax=Venturia inaequalis TaxID=5025 RepID=A0A8H3YZA5_VENIN|nr:hypothetical protein EG328_009107 [Venturia inaequalis]KAE9979705.1 hypothetical protein BLS_009518 [Venturia inaequalis]KAE9980822.1 hypothetical protein EG327_006433 [Venturia inaequalis]RDI76801.1 hypothetical protein Vi05172_g13205 [Venturia inaequalis]